MYPSTILDNRLLIGSCPESAADIDALKAAGISAVLNLQTDDDLLDRDIDWTAMEAHYRRLDVEVRRVPIEDFSPSDLRKKLRACVRILEGLIDAGRTVYVHCNAGINRSPTVAVAYLHWVEKHDLPAAHAHVMSRRPCDPYVQEIVLAPPDAA